MSESFWTTEAVLMPRGERFRTVNGMHGTVPMQSESPPSSYAIASVINGEPGGFMRVIGVTLLRAGFIAPGLWVASRIFPGETVKLGGWQLLGFSVASSTTISLGLLAWYGIRSALAKAQGRAQPLPAGGGEQTVPSTVAPQAPPPPVTAPPMPGGM